MVELWYIEWDKGEECDKFKAIVKEIVVIHFYEEH